MLAVDAAIVDGRTRDAGDIHARAEHAGEIGILINLRPTNPLVVGVAAVALNAVIKATE